MLRNNTAGSGTIEYYGNAGWITVSPILDGSSAAQAAQSAQIIKNVTGTTASGYYYILVAGIATQVYCDMSGSSAWMLLMRTSNQTVGGGAQSTAISYSSAYWTNGATGLNDTGDPTSRIDIKNGALWNGWTVTQLRVTAANSNQPGSFSANPLVTTGSFGATANTIFSQGNNSYDANVAIGRSTWLNWLNSVTGKAVSDFDTQPNCNRDSINENGYVRLGISMNNEADCNTNDSAVGFGVLGYGTGGFSWNPSSAANGHGWLWAN
jgi:hypothetical protein